MGRSRRRSKQERRLADRPTDVEVGTDGLEKAKRARRKYARERLHPEEE